MAGSGIEAPPKPKYRMNKFRKALRKMWADMGTIYRTDGFAYRNSEGRLAFRKVPFPQLYEYEIRQERRKREDSL